MSWSSSSNLFQLLILLLTLSTSVPTSPSNTLGQKRSEDDAISNHNPRPDSTSSGTVSRRYSRNVKTVFRVGFIVIEDQIDQIQEAIRLGLEAADHLLQRHQQARQSDQYLVADKLEAITRTVSRNDPHEALQLGCNLLSQGIVALFGPARNNMSRSLLALANRFHIPYFELDWATASDSARPQGSFAINLFPDLETFGKAVNGFPICDWHANSLSIPSTKCAKTPDLALLKLNTFIDQFDGKIQLKQWQANKTVCEQLFNDLFYQVPREFNFIVELPRESVREFLITAFVYNMSGPGYTYLFTDLDISRENLSMFKIADSANIKTFSLLPKDDQDRNSGRQDNDEHAARMSPQFYHPSNDQLSRQDRQQYPSAHDMNQLGASVDTSTAIIYDSLLLLAHGLISATRTKVLLPQVFECGNTQQPWPFGLTLINAIKSVNKTQFDGLTGPFRLNEKGQRTYFNLKTSVASVGGFKKTGQWNVDEEMKVTTYDNRPKPSKSRQIVLRVTTVEEVDMALAAFTITFEREQFIDFSTPWMTIGSTILYVQPKKQTQSLYSFMHPFSTEIWIYILATYIAVSLCLFVTARLTPYEWKPTHACDQEADIRKNQFTLINSFYYNVSSLLNQGTELAPQATSTRLLTGFWWFFALILIATYTANLAAFLTVEERKSPIESKEDLVEQTKIKYGTISSGSSRDFFNSSEDKIYKKMGEHMTKFQHELPNNVSEGIDRVRKGDFAFILESSWNEFYRLRNCDLMQVGSELDSKGYGIGFPQGSKWRAPITRAILKMQTEQQMEQIHRYWLRQYNNSQSCESTKSSSEPHPLMIDQVGGVFIILCFGFIIGFIVSIIEFFVATRDQKKTEIIKSMWRELKLATRCLSTSKRAQSEVHKLPRSRSNVKLASSNLLVTTAIPQTSQNQQPQHENGRVPKNGSRERLLLESNLVQRPVATSQPDRTTGWFGWPREGRGEGMSPTPISQSDGGRERLEVRGGPNQVWQRNGADARRRRGIE